MEHHLMLKMVNGKVGLTLPVNAVQLGNDIKTVQQVQHLPSNATAAILKLPPGMVLVKPAWRPTLGTVSLQTAVGTSSQSHSTNMKIAPKPYPMARPVTPRNQALVVRRTEPVVHPRCPTANECAREAGLLAPNATSGHSSAEQEQNLKPKPVPWSRPPRPLFKSKEPVVMYSGCKPENLEPKKKKEPPQSLPCPKKLEDILPKSYKYHITSFEEMENPNHFKAEIRLNIKGKDDALQWLRDFEDVSATNFRVTKTFKEKSARVIFKKCFKCHKNTFRKGQLVKRESKRNVCCQARLSITVKNPDMKSSADLLLNDYPCVIGINHNHCHALLSPDSLRYRRPLPEVRDKFADMFREKITPSAALRVHKADLKREYGDKFEEAILDGARCPALPWCYRLYYEICGRKVKDGKKKSTRRNYYRKKNVVQKTTSRQTVHQSGLISEDFNPENCIGPSLVNNKPECDEMQRSVNSLYDYEFMSKNNEVREDSLETSFQISSNMPAVVDSADVMQHGTSNLELLNNEGMLEHDEDSDFIDSSEILNNDERVQDFEEGGTEGEEASAVENMNGSDCSVVGPPMAMQVELMKEKLTQVFNDLVMRLHNQPDIYLPAIQKFISNNERIRQTGSDSDLVVALSEFGKNCKDLPSALSEFGSSFIKAQDAKPAYSSQDVSSIIENIVDQCPSSSSATVGKPQSTRSSKRKVLVLRMNPQKFSQILDKVGGKKLKIDNVNT